MQRRAAPLLQRHVSYVNDAYVAVVIDDIPSQGEIHIQVV